MKEMQNSFRVQFLLSVLSLYCFVLFFDCESCLLDQSFVLSCIVFLYVKFFLERVFFSDVCIVHVNSLVGDIVYVEDETNFLTNNQKKLKKFKKKIFVKCSSFILL